MMIKLPADDFPVGLIWNFLFRNRILEKLANLVVDTHSEKVVLDEIVTEKAAYPTRAQEKRKTN